ncbi:MAG: extracellular solute-binding protein [Alicyclobacillus sp.]|nr:extracellular solute-binding protein [Alicyclobacillus sp.]
MRGRKAAVACASASVLCVSGIIAGCGTQGSNFSATSTAMTKSAASQQQANITFAFWTTPIRTKLTEQAVALFEKKYPNIHVTLEYEPWSNYWTKLATEAASGTLPDVMQMDASYLEQYVTNGSLLNLSDQHVIDLSQLSPQVVNMGKVNGSLYAIPVAVNTFCEILNPKIFKEAGIAVDPNKSYSWQQWFNIMVDVHKKLPSVYGTTDDIYQGAVLAYWARSHGQSLFTADGKSIGISKQVLASWFSYWLNLQEQGGCLPAQQTVSISPSAPPGYPLIKGEVAATYASIGQDGEIQTLLGSPIERMMFPGWASPSKPNILHPAMYWTIWSKTKYPQAAEELVNFLENNPQVAEIFKNDRGVIANQANRNLDAKKFGGLVAQQDEFMDKVEKVSSTVPLDPPQAGEIEGNLLETIGQEVIFKKLTPEQAAEQFIQQADQILKQGQ